MRTPTEVIDASYERISFPPGSTPDWKLFRELFVDGALLGLRVFPNDPRVSIMTLPEYAEHQMREDLKREGYTETPGPRMIDTIGDICVVRQEFTMHFAGQEPVNAVDIFSLVREGTDWRIVSIVSDFATDTAVHTDENATTAP